MITTDGIVPKNAPDTTVDPVVCTVGEGCKDVEMVGTWDGSNHPVVRYNQPFDYSETLQNLFLERSTDLVNWTAVASTTGQPDSLPAPNKSVPIIYSYTDTGVNLTGGAVYYYRMTGIVFADPSPQAFQYNIVAITLVADTQSPTAQIISPANNASVPTTFTIVVNAQDNINLDHVDLIMNDGATNVTLTTLTMFGTSASGYYTLDSTIRPFGPGPHTITAVVYDGAGNSSTSAPVSITLPGVVTGPLQWVDAGTDPPPGPPTNPFFACKNGSCIVTAVVPDHSGHIIVGGYWAGTCDFGNGPVNSTFGTSVTDGFIAKYNATTGAFIWFRQIGGNGNDGVKALVVDSTDRILCVGNFQQTVDFGGGNVTAFGQTDLFVAKYNSDKSFAWVKHFQNLNADTGNVVALTSTNDVVVVADCSYGADFGLGPLGGPTGGPADIDFAIARLSGVDGSTTWAYRYGGSNWDIGRAIAVDGADNVLVCGYVQGQSTDLGLGTKTVPNGSAQFILFFAKYSSAGLPVWGNVFGLSGANLANGIAADPVTGNVIVTGIFNGSIDLGSPDGNFSTSGGGGIFLAGYDPSGNFLWAYVTGSNGDSGAAVRTDGSHLIAGGRATGGLYFGGSLSALGNGQVNSWMATFAISGNNKPTFQFIKYYGQGTDGASNANSVSISGSAFYVGGAFLSTIDFGGISKTAAQAGYSSGFVAKYIP